MAKEVKKKTGWRDLATEAAKKAVSDRKEPVEFSLPTNPTEDQIKELQAYLKVVKKSSKKTVDYYQDKVTLLKGKLILFKHKQQESNNWYMRMYCQNRKYKTLSLKTEDQSVATEKAIEKYHLLQSHIDTGGSVVEDTCEYYLNEYVSYLEKQLSIKGAIKSKKTLAAKRTSLKKLKTKIQAFKKPSDIPPDFLKDYKEWRVTAVVDGGNWDKFHKNNFDPPTDLTIYKEVCDFRGFFTWLKEENYYTKEIKYPKIELNFSKMKEKNPSWLDDDWITTVMWTRTWRTKKLTLDGEKLRQQLEDDGYSKEEIVKKTGLYKRSKKGKFYRDVWIELFKILGNSGCRMSEMLKLRWQDIEYQLGKKYTTKDGNTKQDEIAIISVPPDTKSGRRVVPTGAGVYFRRVYKLYADETGRKPKPSDIIFSNVGTDNSKGDKFIGNALSDSYFRRLFYQMMDEMNYYKDVQFLRSYTVHSARSFYINTRLEMGIPPAVVGKLVGHNLKTMMRHYENIQVMNLKSEIVRSRRLKLNEADFITTDIDSTHLVSEVL